MCSLHSNVIKTPAITHEEKIKGKHKDVNTDASSLLLFYTTGKYRIFYYLFIYILKKSQYTFIIREMQCGTDNTCGRAQFA